MKVILTEDVANVGDIGEEVLVKPGYARNFLIPRGLAIEALSPSARETHHRMRQIESKKRRLKGGAEQQAKRLQSITVDLALNVGSGGKVFGSVGARDIALALQQHGIELDRRRVLLGEPLRKIGEHKVLVKLHQDVQTEITVNIASREATKEEEAQDVGRAREALTTAAAEREQAAASEE